MDRDVLLALVGVLPQLVALVLVVIVGLRYREPIGRALASRGASVSAFGIRLELSAASVEQAVRTRASARGPGSPQGRLMSGEEVVERAARHWDQVSGRTILWVDDNPMGNRIERRLLHEMGIFVETVVSNAEATSVLDDPAEQIDLIITDIDRDEGPDGMELAKQVAQRPKHPDVIFYVERPRPELPVPEGGFGITIRPDVLMNLVIDALDRLPGPAGREPSRAYGERRQVG